MSIPLRQQFAVALYIVKQKLRGVQRYPQPLEERVARALATGSP